MLEPLELRRLLAATAILENGVVKITGTPERDHVGLHIAIGNATDFLLVTAEGQEILSEPLADVQSIEARLGEGGDVLRTDPELDKPIRAFGDGGNDVLSSGAAADHLDGGGEDDILHTSRGADVFVGALGRDTVVYSHYVQNIRVTLDGLANDGAASMPSPNSLPLSEGDNVHSNIEVVIGGQGNDYLEGPTSPLAVIFAPILLDGGPGNDRVVAGMSAGSAVLIGGVGNDELFGGPHRDLLDGRAGNDLMIGNNGPDEFLGGPGTDTANYSAKTANLRITLDGLPNDGVQATLSNTGEGDNVRRDVERVIGGSGDDFISVGHLTNSTLKGEAHPGPIIFEGGPGDDTLVALPPAPTPTPTDEPRLSRMGDWTALTTPVPVDDGALIVDAAAADAGLDATPTLPPTNAVNFFAVLSGGEGDDRLLGSGRTDHLIGGPGNDIMHGNAGSDFLVGGAGNDELFGGAGDDLLDSRDGQADKVDGGDGFDRAIADNLDELLNIESVAP